MALSEERQALAASVSEPMVVRPRILAPMLIGGSLLSVLAIAFAIVGRIAVDKFHETSLERSSGGNARIAGDAAYVCPGVNMTFFYRHGGTSIRVVSANGEISGTVDYRNFIIWDVVEKKNNKLHVDLPEKIEDDAHSVTLNGGSFQKCTVCANN